MKRYHVIKSIIHSYLSAAASKSPTAAGSAPVPKKPTPKPGHKPGGYKLYKYMMFFVCVPMIGAVGYNTYIGHMEDHHKPRPEYVPYDYLCVRNKRFPWGDGTKTLWHNPKKNALKEGYEDAEDED